MLSKEQLRLLKKIKRSECFDLLALPQKLQDDVWFLISKKYVIHHGGVNENDNYTKQLFCKITPLGRAALSQIFRENRHWFIPVIISVFAAIGAYRQEIALIIQAIMNLMK